MQNTLIINNVGKLDEIAWLLNLRGKDIEFNPVFFSYLFIEFDDLSYRATLFIDPKKLTKPVKEYLDANRIKHQPYDEIFSFIKNFDSKTVLLSKNSVS
jgi:Xaa-Pro aminopeptidase